MAPLISMFSNDSDFKDDFQDSQNSPGKPSLLNTPNFLPSFDAFIISLSLTKFALSLSFWKIFKNNDVVRLNIYEIVLLSILYYLLCLLSAT